MTLHPLNDLAHADGLVQDFIGTGLRGSDSLLTVHTRRQHQHDASGVDLAKLLYEFDPAPVGEDKVHNRDFDILGGCLTGLGKSTGLVHHPKTPFHIEEKSQGLAEGCVILDKHDVGHRLPPVPLTARREALKLTFVPLPGSLSTRSSPPSAVTRSRMLFSPVPTRAALES